jgi:pimeloyl-ACP methyl ester carboxylesterase
MRDLVIALHCSGSSARQWRALAERLEPVCRFVAVDLHGHGEQLPWPAQRPMTLADEAELVAPLLAHARRGGPHDQACERVHLIGHSYGGAAALKVASQYPGLVHSVAVYEPVLFRLLFDDPASAAEGLEASALVDDMARWHRQGNNERAAQRFIDYWSGSGSWARLPEKVRAATKTQVPTLLAHFHALFHEHVLAGALADLRPLALVLTGARTVASTWRIGERLRVRMPAARHETLTGLEHMAPISHAEHVNARFVSFLQGVGADVRASRIPTAGRPSPRHLGPI